MEEPENVIIKADEVDEPPPPPEAFSAAVQDHPIPSLEPLRASTQTNSIDSERPNGLPSRIAAPPQARPALSRDITTPPTQGTWIDLHPSNPPLEYISDDSQHNPGLWNPPTTTSSESIDSLSLGQLRRIVHEMPRFEPAPYAFEYSDTSTFAEELEELFDYTWEERSSILRVRKTFERLWDEFTSTYPSADNLEQTDWLTSNESMRRAFIEVLWLKIEQGDDADKMESFESLVHLALGCWHETAGLQDSSSSSPAGSKTDSEYRSSAMQISTIKDNVSLIIQVIQPRVFFNIMRRAYDPQALSRDGIDGENYEIDTQPDIYQQSERWLSTVFLYLLIDLAGRDPESVLARDLRSSLQPIQFKLLMFLTDIFAKSRWDDSNGFPSPKLLLLYWKTILLIFGGLPEVKTIKDALAGKETDTADVTNQDPLITASPLDYHVFRQEIISKYPAYNPPPPIFPFEHDNNSFLPSLQDSNGKNASMSTDTSNAGPASIPGAGTSIMNQPVHIATPAPSPPPSPAGPGGKGPKKQNYQTNQMFPFLYPPLDESSNDLGGKGTTELQDLLAGRKWQGSDIPASILEAAQLFSKRMRATRAMKQLWGERVRFLKHEQSYAAHGQHESSLKISDEQDDEPDEDQLQLLDEHSKTKMASVEEFYKASLPRLQSLVFVLLRTLVQSIATLITQTDALEGLPGNSQSMEQDGQPRTQSHFEGEGVNGTRDDNRDPSFNDLVSTRNQEIMSKAVSGILVLLLKWFKLSHILKFEYLAQLLFDSNYIQLVLKLFAHQELERAVTYRCERKDLNFFNFCMANSRTAKTPANAEAEPEEDFDDAVPPPIGLTREQNSRSVVRLNAAAIESEDAPASFAPTPAPTQPPPPPPAPEVDELGYPMSTLPTEPITNYSWRTFYTAINYLKILQKVLKSKPHRQLLMVQGKYSNTLKKHLKVPQSDIRLYTLKIIKGQVPYCHRKWRQGNMRIITAIYLHVKPGLRDEWLSGLDVEQEVGEALPAEQALRALTYWYNLRRYPDEMGAGDSESDFGSDLGSTFALSDLGLDADLEHDADTIPREESVKEDLKQETGEIQHPKSSPPDPTAAKVLQEQDFFLRELEKMDLGLSLYGVPSSALSPSQMQPTSPQQPASAGSPPPSTRILPMPDIVSAQLMSDHVAESPPKLNRVTNSEPSTAIKPDVGGKEIDGQQPHSSQQLLTESIQNSLVDSDSTFASTSDPLLNNGSDPEFGVNMSESPKPEDSDVIVIAKDTSPGNVTLDTAATMDHTLAANSDPGVSVSVEAIADDEDVEGAYNGVDNEHNKEDADMIADEDAEEGENMVLAQ